MLASQIVWTEIRMVRMCNIKKGIKQPSNEIVL